MKGARFGPPWRCLHQDKRIILAAPALEIPQEGMIGLLVQEKRNKQVEARSARRSVPFFFRVQQAPCACNLTLPT